MLPGICLLHAPREHGTTNRIDTYTLYPMDDSPQEYWLGYRGQGTEWAHADGSDANGHHAIWPYYQAPPGELNALLDLCQYPQGTDFLVVDDIDRVLLLLAEPFRRNSEDIHDENFYAAAWHEDLKSLHDQGLIDGLSWGNEDEWSHRRWMNVFDGLPPDFDGLPPDVELFFEASDGTFIPIQPPPIPEPSDHDDPLEAYEMTWPLIQHAGTRIRVTAEGWARMGEFLRDALTLGPDLSRVSTLLKLGYGDTAVREASVTLESMLRRRINTDRFGIQLISLVTAHLEQAGVDLRHLRIVSTRLRTIFKFVRMLRVSVFDGGCVVAGDEEGFYRGVLI